MLWFRRLLKLIDMRFLGNLRLDGPMELDGRIKVFCFYPSLHSSCAFRTVYGKTDLGDV